MNRIRVSARTMTPSGSRRAPLQARSNKTVEEILDAAPWLLGRVPFEEIPTSRIAGQAGISVGALYRFYSDRSPNNPAPVPPRFAAIRNSRICVGVSAPSP